MTATGPYNSPMALAVRPWGSLFWSLWAYWFLIPLLFQFVQAFAPDLYELAGSDAAGGARALWLVFLIAEGSALVFMIIWAERIGAGSFAGVMRINPGVAGLSLVGGPMVMYIAFVFTAAIFANGDPNWAIRDGIDLDIYNPETAGILLFVSIVVVAPIFEEVALRGIGMGCLLARGWEPGMVIGLNALIFTLMHTQYNPPALIPIFITGAFLGWLRVRTGSIAAPILAHMGANGFQFIG